jgi:hypothetical protein
MHDYTARILHEDRMRQLRGEADEMRLAAQIREARQTRSASGAGSSVFARLAARYLIWWRGHAKTHRLRGGLGAAADPKLGENT